MHRVHHTFSQESHTKVSMEKGGYGPVGDLVYCEHECFRYRTHWWYTETPYVYSGRPGTEQTQRMVLVTNIFPGGS